MKFIIRFVILVIILRGTPPLTPTSYAISGSVIAQESFALTAFKKRQSVKPKRRIKLRLKPTHRPLYRRTSPKKIFFTGLAMIAVSGLLTLLGFSYINSGTENALLAVMLIITGGVGLIAGGVVALVGGIWWLIERYG